MITGLSLPQRLDALPFPATSPLSAILLGLDNISPGTSTSVGTTGGMRAYMQDMVTTCSAFCLTSM